MSVAACGRCDAVAPVKRRLADGTPLCRTCWRRDPASWKICSGCGQSRPVNARDDAGRPVCVSCYRQLAPTRACDGCGRERRIVSRREGSAWCETCYRQVRPRRRCGGCGRVTAINKRGRDGSPDLCAACNFAPTATCVRCGVEAMCRRADGTGPPTCLRCVATTQLDELLTGPNDTIDEAFDQIRQVFATAPQPRSILVWLQRSPGAQLLRQLVAGEIGLDHTSLDRLPQTPSLHHLRQLLIATGVLDEHDLQLTLLEQAARRHAATLGDSEDRQIFLAYVSWSELPRLRRRYPNGIPPLAATTARARMATAARLLTHLTDQDDGLATVTQSEVNSWITAHPGQQQTTRAFLMWAVRHRHAPPDVTVAVRPGGQSSPRPLAPDARWQLARRLLHDDTLEVADRVAGILVVLYAQPVARIVRLTCDDIDDQGTRLTICFGADDVEIPVPLAQLARQLPAPAQTGPSGSVRAARRWLFPGRQAGLPMHPSTLARRLHRVGIDVRAARNAAMLQLAAEIPAAVLADTLSIDVGTATRWAASAGATWSRYAAARTSSTHPIA